MSDWEKCFTCPTLLVETIDERLKRKQAKSVRQASKQIEKESEGTWPVNTIRSLYNRHKHVDALASKPKNIAYDTCTTSDLHSLVEAGKTFGTIYADPPWAYSNQGTRAATSNHYETMSPKEIASLPVAQLTAEKAHLHLWTTNAFLFECPQIMEAWGFQYKGVFVWVKPQMGIGNYWRVSHEFMLLGVKGGLTFQNHSHMSWSMKDRTKHSAKPEEVANIIEKVSPGPYLELFGRNPRVGWVVYGNEIERTMFTEAAFG